jgi:hypothetical protein
VLAPSVTLGLDLKEKVDASDPNHTIEYDNSYGTCRGIGLASRLRRTLFNGQI